MLSLPALFISLVPSAGLPTPVEAGRSLIRVDFVATIKTTTNAPFDQPDQYWKDREVTGYFLYDPATPNALTPDQVRKKRLRFQHNTVHAYLQNLRQPGFQLDLPGHTITGSRRSLIQITHRSMDSNSSSFQLKDGQRAWLKFAQRKQHGRISVDGIEIENAKAQLLFNDFGKKLQSADLPTRFPLKIGRDLMMTTSVTIEGKSILFQIHHLSSSMVAG